MKLESDIKINNRTRTRGADVPWYTIYPFFLIHMLIFGGSGFLIAYINNGPPLFFPFLHGGIAVVIYTAFYIRIFGRDEVKWMFINAGLGLLVIYTQIGWILSLFGKEADDYQVYKHVTPFLYFVLYTLLIRHAVLDLMKAREDDKRKKKVESVYIAASVTIYVISYLFERR